MTSSVVEPVIVPKDQDIELDENVLKVIPNAALAAEIRATLHGASSWDENSLHTREVSERERNQVLPQDSHGGERSRDSARGIRVDQVIHTTIPGFAPEPIAWGSFRGAEDHHFFLSSFHEMKDEVSEIEAFVRCLASLHMNALSPNGKYGFHVTTYNGNIPQDVRWTDTWEECFLNGTKQDFELEREARGPSDELDQLRTPLLEKVIPRLLRPLESGGRHVKPSFLHGDLWYGNRASRWSSILPDSTCTTSVQIRNKTTVDIKAMRKARYRFGRDYMKAYQAHFPISKPIDDLEARLALYSLRSYLHESTLYVDDPRPREALIRETKKLVQAFPDGLNGYDLELGQSIHVQ
ncbi:Uu.00g090270.m01.CDS01 [Anthostomella pinea]|uniref:protein-ribulosamine 3-kinase n=1 Tax=Anthostomella pinea TaxID=933095 RepID=A0AAI8VNS7_9PEZI|nr:Uu.00g090270.m01.CDS01 [Anthostomella pinea]